ncbi:MAG: hypothetical protein ABIJ42_08185 [Acidobacteriota bacterium]
MARRDIIDVVVVVVIFIDMGGLLVSRAHGSVGSDPRYSGFRLRLHPGLHVGLPALFVDAFGIVDLNADLEICGGIVAGSMCRVAGEGSFA